MQVHCLGSSRIGSESPVSLHRVLAIVCVAFILKIDSEDPYQINKSLGTSCEIAVVNIVAELHFVNASCTIYGCSNCSIVKVVVVVFYGCSKVVICGLI